MFQACVDLYWNSRRKNDDTTTRKYDMLETTSKWHCFWRNLPAFKNTIGEAFVVSSFLKVVRWWVDIWEGGFNVSSIKKEKKKILKD